MIKFLFGKAGSGKTHIGEAARGYGFHFHDADADLPEDFRKAMARGGGVTEAMRAELTAALIATVKRLSAEHPKVCISQALVRNRIRASILEAVPAVELVWVDAPDEVLRGRLQARTGHIATETYARDVNGLFEIPTVPHARFMNDGDAARFAEQMEKVFGARTEG